MNRALTLFITLLPTAFFFTGCGHARPDGMPRLYPASITVIQDGAPLEGAMVQLFSEDPALERWGPTGITNAAGVVAIRTDAAYNGAPLGTYKVVVTKMEREPHPNPEWADAPRGDPNAQKYEALELSRKMFNYIEPQYSSHTDTPLTVEIVAKKKNYSVDIGKYVKNRVTMNP